MKLKRRNKLKKQRKLIWQIVPIVLIFMSLATAFSGFAMYQSSMSIFMDEKEASARNLARFAKEEMVNTPNIEWLVDYWKNNYDDMDIFWEDEIALTELRLRFLNANPGLDINQLPETTLQSLDNESQKLYAEIAYMDLIMTFDKLKEIYNPLFLYSFCIVEKTDGPDQRLFLLTAKKENETRGTGEKDIYLLGHHTDLQYDTHPLLVQTYKTGKELPEYEKTDGHEELRIHVYVPLTDKHGKTIAIVSVTMDADEIQSTLLHRLAVIELLAFMFFLLSVTAIILLLRSMVVNPICDMQRSVNAFGNDMDAEKLSRKLEHITMPNEIGFLASTVSSMGASLAYYMDTTASVTAKQERINTELALASRIQDSSLPKNFDILPKEWNIKLFASMDPAKEVGGDFYDFIKIDDDHLALVIADVSGKGIPAALFMMISQLLIANNTFIIEHPSLILQSVNDRFCEHDIADMFVTVWLGILEISTGIITASNAGHEYPIIKRANELFELFNDAPHGLVVGGMSGIKYKDYQFTLADGDILFVYTDGVVEATKADNAQYGTYRLLQTLNSANANSPKELIERVATDIEFFAEGTEQFDDITMMALCYHTGTEL